MEINATRVYFFIFAGFYFIVTIISLVSLSTFARELRAISKLNHDEGFCILYGVETRRSNLVLVTKSFHGSEPDSVYIGLQGPSSCIYVLVTQSIFVLIFLTLLVYNCIHAFLGLSV